jgi:hypothetical protein
MGYMQWPLAVMSEQHLCALLSHFILALSQVLFIVGGVAFPPVPASVGVVKATANPRETAINTVLRMTFLPR